MSSPKLLVSPRVAIQVAVGILVREDNAVLLTTRPAGKVYAGYWEFPGGKLEQGESIGTALRRELHEELGIEITGSTLWKTTQHDYEHALVNLHWCKVYSWTGMLQMREAQKFSWQFLPVDVSPVLPGSIPLLELMQREGVRA